MLLVSVALILFRPLTWPLWLASVGMAFGAVNAAMRRSLSSYPHGPTNLLAIPMVPGLFYEYWFVTLVLAVVRLVVLMPRDIVCVRCLGDGAVVVDKAP